MRPVRFSLAFLLVLPGVAFGASARAVATYVDLPDGAQPTALAADSAGNLFVAANVTEPSGRQQLRVIKTNSQGITLASVDFGGSGSDGISGAAVDPSGNLILVGGTDSPDFPLVSPLISKTSQNSAFIMKFDSVLQNILFSTRLGGTQGGFGGTSGAALALDADGNIYLTGSTADTDFPVTPGAFQTQPPPNTSPSVTYAYVTEISGDGKEIVFSTYFGSGHVACTDPGFCGEATYPVAIALDDSANVVVAGTTDSDRLPTTPGVFGPTCGACSGNLFTSFLAKFAPGGSKLLWATYLPVSASGSTTGIQVHAMALDHSGNVIIGGSTSKGFSVTAGAVQMTFPDSTLPGSAGFVAKFDSSAEHLLFSTYFGGGAGLGVTALTLDSQGTIWLTGSLASNLPGTKGTPPFGPDFVAGLAEDGSAVANIFTAPEGAAGQAILETSAGTTVALGSAASLLTVSSGAGFSLIAVTNAAASDVSSAIAPTELISLYGISLGPSTPASAQVVNGEAPISLGGVQVLFDGDQAQLLYVGPNQINAVVPEEVLGRETTALQIVTPSGTLDSTIPIRLSEPQVFVMQGPGQTYPTAAALNEDGTLNSAASPAAPGSIVAIWATGSLPGLPVSVLRVVRVGVVEQGAYSLEVLYAGQAPGMVDGIMQINFRLPPVDEESPTFAFQLQIGDALSDPFLLYTQD